MQKLWQTNGSHQTETEKAVEAFTVGNDYKLDQVLIPYDLKASAVHAKALQKAGILTEEELKQLTAALSDIMTEWESGNFKISVGEEDMHTAIENALVDKLGDTGLKIHTARSRNDQVLTALRLYEKESLDNILNQVRELANNLIEFGLAHEHLPMPGYTHSRKAMLSSVGLWTGGFAELLIMQLEAANGVSTLINRSPLGTAAGYGTSFDIDREFAASELGFDKPIICSTTAQLTRGWAELQLVQYLCCITAALNRLSADIIRFSGEETQFFELDPAICSGSSIMPQKMNPDLAELIRAGHADLIGYAGTLQTLAVNLGSGYHRDLQLSKEPVLKAFERTKSMLQASSILISNLSVSEENLKNSCDSSIFAAEQAYSLVKEKGIPFRSAYQIIKNRSESDEKLSISDLMEKYSHTGSPGNTGLNLLKEMISW